jgi:hypothetical protein
MLQIFLISVVFIGLALLALAIRLLFVKEGKFSGGSCKVIPSEKGEEFSCACGQPSSCDTPDQS